MEFVPGAVIGGRYRLERKIAEGGMGEVWVGLAEGGKQVAIKRLLPDAAKDRELVTRFRREALLLSKIQSDHVSKVFEKLEDPSFGETLVMEFVEGESLAEVLEKRKVLSVEEVLDLGVDLGRAIADLHRASIVHRDLKPENVILRRAPNGARTAVLIDFGLARQLGGREDKSEGEETLTGITRAESAVGTIAYMAPEQILSSRDVSRAADVYALGAILYRFASGRNVFGDTDDMSYARQKLNEEAPPVEIARKDGVAQGLAAIITRAVKRRPAERYESMAPMLADLEKARSEGRGPPSGDIDAPTQHAPVSSLLGVGGAKFSLDPPAPQQKAENPYAATMLPGADIPLPASVRVAPMQAAPMQTAPTQVAPTPAATVLVPPTQAAQTPAMALNRLSAPKTIPIMQAMPMASPAPQMQFAPPPTPQTPAQAFARAPMSSVTEIGPSIAARIGGLPQPNSISRKAAALGAFVALVVGFVLGFVAHAAVSSPAAAEAPVVGAAKK